MPNLVSQALGERFSFQIANTSGAAKKVAILAAFFHTLKSVSGAEGAADTLTYTDATAIAAAGYACDAVCDDGTIAAGIVVTAENPKMTMRAFREYIQKQPKVVVDMSVQASNVSAFNGVMEFVKCSPLIGSASQYLPLTKFRSVDQTATDKVNVRNLQLELDFDTLVLLPIPDGVTMSIEFNFQ